MNILEQLKKKLEPSSRQNEFNLRVFVLDEEAVKDSPGPGVYVETNIPFQLWHNDAEIRAKVGTALTLDEKIQQLVGIDSSQTTVIPIGDEKEVPTNLAINASMVATTKRGNCVVLKLERAKIGEVVRQINQILPKL